MAWSHGSGLFAELIYIVQKNVSEDSDRRQIYEHMIDSFEELDCDDLEECKGVDPIFDEVHDEKYPSEDEDLEEYEE